MDEDENDSDADEDVEEGPAHLRFKLDKDGGEGIYLSRMLEDGGLEQVDAVEFSAQAVDTSSARMPDGTGDWTDGSSPTPGSPNG